MRKIIYILFMGGFTYISALQAQENQDTTPITIDQQFTELYQKSGNYQEYKVVKKASLNTLQANAKSRIDGLQTDITSLNTTITSQKTEIDKLNQNLLKVQTDLTTITGEKDTMTFFGTRMSKSGFQTVVWSIVGVLLLGLLFFIYKFKNSNIITNSANRKLDEIEIEFEEYRKKALEKEQKMGRLLQDERNKVLKASKG